MSASAFCPRRPGPQATSRDYSAAHVRRLTFTRRARDLGFSIEQIRALFDLADLNHVANPDTDRDPERAKGAAELIEVVRTYLK